MDEQSFAHSKGRVLLATYLIIDDRTRAHWTKGEDAWSSYKNQDGVMSNHERYQGWIERPVREAIGQIKKKDKER